MSGKRASRSISVAVVFTMALGAWVAATSLSSRAGDQDKGASTNERDTGKAPRAPLVLLPSAPLAPSAKMDLAAIPADPAFDHLVDLNLIRHAWEALAPEVLTDVALQLVAAEHILLRTHKSGITADHLLGLAAKLAAEKKDKASLGRLAKAAEARNDKGLAKAIGTAMALMGDARGVEPGLTISIDRVDPAAVARFQKISKAIQAVRVLGSAETLDSLEKQLPKENLLPEEQRTYLAATLKDAKTAIRQGAKPTADPLKKLLSPSRDFFSQFDPTNPQSDIWHPGNAPQIVNPYDSGLYFRNSTPKTVFVAVSFLHTQNGELSDGTDLGPAINTWFVTGWTMIQPNYTSRIFNSITNRFYYWYAMADGTEWAGPGDHNYWVLTYTPHFTYSLADPQQVNAIRSQGNALRRFNTLNTGDYSAYTINLRQDGDREAQEIRTYAVPLDAIWSGSGFRNIQFDRVFSMTRRPSNRQGKSRDVGLWRPFRGEQPDERPRSWSPPPASPMSPAPPS